MRIQTTHTRTYTTNPPVQVRRLRQLQVLFPNHGARTLHQRLPSLSRAVRNREKGVAMLAMSDRRGSFLGVWNSSRESGDGKPFNSTRRYKYVHIMIDSIDSYQTSTPSPPPLNHIFEYLVIIPQLPHPKNHPSSLFF